MTPKRGLVVAVEGVCGSGKSAACRWIEQNAARVMEWSGYTGGVRSFYETPDPETRDAFYADPERMAFFFQSTQQRRCLENLQKAHTWAAKTGGVAFIDRAAMGNATFAFLNATISDKRINAEQLDNYAYFTQYCLNMFTPDATILLDTPLDVCMARLEKRRADTHESIPSRDYMEQLRASHDRLIGYDMHAAPVETRVRCTSRRAVLHLNGTESVADVVRYILLHATGASTKKDDVQGAEDGELKDAQQE